MNAYTPSDGAPEACHSSVTSPAVSVLDATRDVINGRKNGGSWRKLSSELDVPHGILHAIGTGAYSHISWDTVRKVRRHLGLDDPGELIPALSCPDCGLVHTGRCYGKPAVQVVVLGEGERVAQASKPRKRKARSVIEVPPDLKAVLNAERQRQNMTWAEYIEDLALKAQRRSAA